MVSLRKALLYGLFIWLITFGVAFAIFPLRASARPLFESIMPVALACSVVAFAVRYVRAVNAGFVREGLRLGLLWLAINVALDAPLMLFGGPMHMTVGQYAADIAVTYLMMPVITTGIAVAGARRSA